MTLHDTKKFDNDLRGRADENLAFSAPLSVDNVVLQRMRDQIDEHQITQCDLPGSRSTCVVRSSGTYKGKEERTRTDTRTIFRRRMRGRVKRA